ncbi:MAG: hypothetical protein GXP58_05185 [Deltaproteobacteria bacterium]|nr:hypothetical protein [Deltaproteobacteria bacterium]
MISLKKKIKTLGRILADSGKTLILTHDNPDPDAIAAALGWQYFLRSYFGREGIIVYGGIIGRAENQAMIESLRIPLISIDRINFQDYSRVALVDTQPLTGNNSLPDSVIPDMVIDHHPLREATKRVSFYDVRERVGASCTLVTAYLRETDTPIQPRLATALYYGIKSDTQDLGRNASALDVESYLFLFPQVQRDLINRILHPKVSAEYFKVLNRAFKKARIRGDTLTTSIGRIRNPDMVAEVADMLLRHEGVEWVMAMGTFRKAMILSLRTSDLNGGAGVIAQSIVRGVGKAGGHGMIAGGKVELKGKSLRDLEVILVERFLKKVGTLNKPAEALV